ncbi:MAG: RNA polymerase sigma-70 factor (ECF subfamily) [Myxococcota bacterium]|jgi:RNA polymerase sigma-70 factor (ECF subfamily)
MDATAFNALYTRYARFVLARCRAVCGNQTDAEEALQDTFIRAWNNRERFDGRSPLGWLHTLARSASIDLLRKRRPWNTSPEAWDFDRLLGAEGVDGGARVDVTRLLESLDPIEAAMLRLRHIEDWRFIEIAEHFEMSERSVRRQLQALEERARVRLADV